jgi:hypothetical protein
VQAPPTKPVVEPDVELEMELVVVPEVDPEVEEVPPEVLPDVELELVELVPVFPLVVEPEVLLELVPLVAAVVEPLLLPPQASSAIGGRANTARKGRRIKRAPRKV